MKRVLLLAAMVPAAGFAQSTTTCDRSLGWTVCQTVPSRPLDGYAEALGSLPSYSEQEAQKAKLRAARKGNDALERDMRRQAQPDPVEFNSRCLRAIKLALDSGAVDAAKSLADRCSPD